MSNMIIHKASTRGRADHGWLNSFHTFTFSSYYNEDRVHFGALRVLNDDTVAPGMGFGTHPHNNMEIISIPLEGDLEHKDSMGNVAVIKHGDVQVMSAGKGISHSEYNKNSTKPVKFLQIWVFPDKKDVTPRYGQMTLNPNDRLNKWQQIISPNQADEGLWIHQQAWFHLGKFTEKKNLQYELHNSNNGLYTFVLSGNLKLNNAQLEARDGAGIWNTKTVGFEMQADSEVLLMEVPMI
jgi:quercetin 2,3-dioxygenase